MKLKPITFVILIVMAWLAGSLVTAFIYHQIYATSPRAAADSSLPPPVNLTSVSSDLTELVSSGDAEFDLTLSPLLYLPVYYCPTTRTPGYQMPDGSWRVLAFYEQTRSRLVLWDEEDMR